MITAMIFAFGALISLHAIGIEGQSGCPGCPPVQQQQNTMQGGSQPTYNTGQQLVRPGQQCDASSRCAGGAICQGGACACLPGYSQTITDCIPVLAVYSGGNQVQTQTQTQTQTGAGSGGYPYRPQQQSWPPYGGQGAVQTGQQQYPQVQQQQQYPQQQQAQVYQGGQQPSYGYQQAGVVSGGYPPQVVSVGQGQGTYQGQGQPQPQPQPCAYQGQGGAGGAGCAGYPSYGAVGGTMTGTANTGGNQGTQGAQGSQGTVYTYGGSILPRPNQQQGGGTPQAGYPQQPQVAPQQPQVGGQQTYQQGQPCGYQGGGGGGGGGGGCGAAIQQGRAGKRAKRFIFRRDG